jgi:hypothetical protein
MKLYDGGLAILVILMIAGGATLPAVEVDGKDIKLNKEKLKIEHVYKFN